MKTTLVSVLALAAVLGTAFAPNLAATPQATKAYAVRVKTAENCSWMVQRGTRQQVLLNRFGAPDEKLSADVWVYTRFHAVPGRRETNRCNKLVVTLADGVVMDMHLVNERARNVLAARGRVGRSPTLAATR